jgi:hypothetical protein
MPTTTGDDTSQGFPDSGAPGTFDGGAGSNMVDAHGRFQISSGLIVTLNSAAEARDTIADFATLNLRNLASTAIIIV